MGETLGRKWPSVKCLAPKAQAMPPSSCALPPEAVVSTQTWRSARTAGAVWFAGDQRDDRGRRAWPAHCSISRPVASSPHHRTPAMPWIASRRCRSNIPCASIAVPPRLITSLACSAAASGPGPKHKSGRAGRDSQTGSTRRSGRAGRTSPGAQARRWCRGSSANAVSHWVPLCCRSGAQKRLR